MKKILKFGVLQLLTKYETKKFFVRILNELR